MSKRNVVASEQVKPGLFCVQGEWKSPKPNPSVVERSRYEVQPPSTFEYSFSSGTSAVQSTCEEFITCDIEFEVRNRVYFFDGLVKKNNGESSSSLKLWSDNYTSRNSSIPGGIMNRPCTVWVFFDGENNQSHQFGLLCSVDPKKFCLYCVENLMDDFLHIQSPGTIKFHLWIEFNEEFTQSQKNILLRLTSMYDYQLSCDVKFSFPNGEIIGAHLNVLSALNPILASMFNGTVQNEPIHQVDIKDITVENFEVLLYFVYSGRLRRPLTEDMARSLYVAAYKYGMTDLMSESTTFLLRSVRMENALELLVWSDLYSSAIMKATVLRFIGENGPVLCNTKDWDNLAKNNHELCVMATRRIVENLSNNVTSYRAALPK